MNNEQKEQKIFRSISGGSALNIVKRLEKLGVDPKVLNPKDKK